KGEENCPHYPIIQPIISKIEEADFIILATPVFVMSCSGSMKALLDHLAYMWMVHRPKETMFHKVGLIVTTSGGAGVKSTTKLLRTNMFYWGIPKIYKYSITTMKMQGNYAEYEHKDEIKQAVRKKTKRIKRSLSNRKVGLKTKIFFNVFKMSQKKGWVPKDANYWKEKGWLDGKRPY
ncbi:MAG: NAD(P)H-dependent oxidoreductase, partial [Coprobacillus sp.]